MSDHVRAPWTQRQVEALNAYQAGETDGHPYTCPMHSCGHVLLVATPDGWRCSDSLCDYRQNWAHAWTAQRTRERWNICAAGAVDERGWVSEAEEGG